MKNVLILSVVLLATLIAVFLGLQVETDYCAETRTAKEAARANEVQARADWLVARAKYNAAIMSYLSGTPSPRKHDGAPSRIDIENEYNAAIAA